MIEVRFHGRGGQGAVIASRILAVAFAQEGWHVQSFPAFGVERRGAPVLAFLRIGHRKFYSRYQIYQPDHVIVLDDSLLEILDVSAGLKPEGHLLLNSDSIPPSLKEKCAHNAWVNASSIAVELKLGSPTAPIVNTAMVGAFAGAWKLLEFGSLEKALRDEIPSYVDANVKAARRAFETVTAEQTEVRK